MKKNKQKMKRKIENDREKKWINKQQTCFLFSFVGFFLNFLLNPSLMKNAIVC